MRNTRLRDRLMGYDSYERHRAVSIFLAGELYDTVLDVGGLSRGLDRFLPGELVLALNLDATGDVAYEGESIPFADRAFNVVVSLDTIEHMPPDARAFFLKECARVAGQALLIAAPYGTPGHSAYEAKLDRLWRDVQGNSNRWLHEHVVNGLPNDEEIAGYRQILVADGFTVRVYYSGDYRWQCRNLERSLDLARKLGPFRTLAGTFNLLTVAADWSALAFSETPCETTNRFYCLAHRR